MSCEHGNHELSCDLCDAQSRAYERGVADAEQEVRRLRAENERLQARIDALMFEYCQLEMTPEQISNWGRNQKPAEQ